MSQLDKQNVRRLIKVIEKSLEKCLDQKLFELNKMHENDIIETPNKIGVKELFEYETNNNCIKKGRYHIKILDKLPKGQVVIYDKTLDEDRAVLCNNDTGYNFELEKCYIIEISRLGVIVSVMANTTDREYYG